MDNHKLLKMKHPLNIAEIACRTEAHLPKISAHYESALGSTYEHHGGK